MLVSAQRVRSPIGLHGVNVYEYIHGVIEWAVPPLDATDANLYPRQLVAKWEQVPAGGNYIRSFVDLVVPDEDYAELYVFAVAAVGNLQPQQFPWQSEDGTIGLRFSVLDPNLFPVWRSELKDLLRFALLP